MEYELNAKLGILASTVLCIMWFYHVLTADAEDEKNTAITSLGLLFDVFLTFVVWYHTLNLIGKDIEFIIRTWLLIKAIAYAQFTIAYNSIQWYGSEKSFNVAFMFIAIYALSIVVGIISLVVWI
jgi:hypothetical protein